MRRKRLGLFKDDAINQSGGYPQDKEIRYDTHEREVAKLENKIELLARHYNQLHKDFKMQIMKKKDSLLLNKLRRNNNAVDKANVIKNDQSYLDEEKNVLQAKNTYANSSAEKFGNDIRRVLPNGSPVIAVVVISCNRVTIQQCLDELLKWRPSMEQFPIIVSEDCSHQPTINVIRSYGDQVTLIQQPDQSEIPIPPKEKKFKGYFKIARHYGWALNQTFFNFKFDTAIIVEDDLTIAPDFFEYFLGTYWLLKKDPTLWCVSAWNDNGKSGLIDESQADLLHRTDFFPGLGWMLTSSVWAELSVKWPKSYWDDWIRKPEQRKDRACIRPELPRTKTFGKIGVSNGMFYEKHLKFIKLNNRFVNFTKLNLSYLLKDNYDVAFVKDVYTSTVVSYQELKNGSIVTNGSVRIPYLTKDQYKKTAKYIGLMDDFRSGVPRTAYRGVVTFSYKGRRVYLAPHSNWKSYDITWS
ncbi:hypothetical protein RUM44_006645 [Polyplax serrata]|uniref:Alpha-1,3-mannosyl-glycoprotein 2-beta-N-acetylglucosaminyltransferase n=1 Tax=Polyplax serrata TaxID=468196 RepID=A0ABR1AIQ1_POLSC